MSKFRFVFGKKNNIKTLWHIIYKVMWWWAICFGAKFCTYATNNRFFGHKIIFLFKKLHHVLRENCVRSPYLDIKS